MDAKLNKRLLFAIIMITSLLMACSLGSLASGVADSVTKELAATPAKQKEAGEQPPAENGQQPAGQPTTEVELNIPAGPPTPTPFVYNGTNPKSGTGGVYGRVLWNGEPAAGIQVKLCDEVKFIGGCTGNQYPATTGSDGVYVILDVPPRKYGLTYKALDGDNWYFITSGFLNARDFEVPAGQMVNAGDQNTVRTDVKILSPSQDERLEGVRRPTITWQAYLQAAYYELTFHAGRGGSLIHRLKLTEPTFVMNRDLQSCEYTFKVEVFNSQQIQIAENDGWHNFKIAGLPESCIMTATSPADGATVKSTDITLTWQPHAWAKTYKILLNKKGESATKILDFVETTEASYKITQNVPPGTYQWVVYAYDEFGDGLGFTNNFDLNVTTP